MISRQDLRVLVNGELLTGRLKGKTRKQQSKAFGIKLHQLPAYLDGRNVPDEVYQKLGGYFGEVVDNSEFKTASKSIYLGKPRNDQQARDKQKVKADYKKFAARRAIEDHKERLALKEELGLI